MTLNPRNLLVVALVVAAVVLLTLPLWSPSDERGPEHVVAVASSIPEEEMARGELLEAVSSPIPTSETPGIRPVEVSEFNFEDKDIRLLAFDGIKGDYFRDLLRANFPKNIHEYLDDAMIENLEELVVGHYSWLFTHDPAFLTAERKGTDRESVPPPTREYSEEYVRVLFRSDVERIYIAAPPITLHRGDIEGMMKGIGSVVKENPSVIADMKNSITGRGLDPEKTLVVRSELLVKTQDGEYRWSRMYLYWNEESQRFLWLIHHQSRVRRPETQIPQVYQPFAQ